MECNQVEGCNGLIGVKGSLISQGDTVYSEQSSKVFELETWSI